MTQKYYEGGHTAYTASEIAPQDSRLLNIINTVNRVAKTGAKLLDIGCGDTYLRSKLPGVAYTGLDLDTSKADGITKHDITVTPYPFEAGSFDVIVCSEVLEHLFHPEVVLAEINRLLSPHGTAIVTTPNFECIDLFLTHYTSLVYDKKNTFSVEHIRQYTPTSLQALLKAHGLEPVNTIGNSVHLSGFFKNARTTLLQFLRSQSVSVGPVETDQILGLMFPTLCPGILVEARKS